MVCRRRAYPAVLANPAAIVQYSGIKHADDKNDAFFLAELQRLNILPTGYIYDPELRPVRDLLRRRVSLVHQRTALMLSFKSLYARTTGQEMSLNRLKGMEPAQAAALYEHPANQLIAKMQKEHIEQLNKSIGRIEKAGTCLRAGTALLRTPQHAARGGTDTGDDDHDGSGRHRPVQGCRTFRQLLSGGGCAADQQREGQRIEQPQMRQQVSGVGVCGGGQLRQTL